MENNQEKNKVLEQQIEELKKLEQANLEDYIRPFEDPRLVKKQTDNAHEIHISMTANILKQQEDNQQYPESILVYTNNYFIPVPSGQDYNDYATAFFNYIETCMIQSADQATEEPEHD